MRAGLVFVVLFAAAPALTQTAAPVEHRLTPEQIAAAQADGDNRNRAAELLAMTRGEPSLALPGEKPKKWHGTAEIGIGSNGYREFAGEVSTAVGSSGTATIAGDYSTYNAPYRLHTRPPAR